MKRINYLLVALAAICIATACNNVSYKKTKSGLLYKIIPSDSKDSVAKDGDYLKLHFTQKLNDSLLQNTFGKMPIYQKLAPNQQEYNPAEIFHLLKKGDSVVAVLLIDSILKKGLMQELPPFMKKGDRLTIGIRVVDVIRNDSLYQVDSKMEYEKDAPRQRKEQEEEMARMQKESKERQLNEEAELEKSGEIEKQMNDLQARLASKGITVQKAGKGTLVHFDQQGTGPIAESGKFVTVKYQGKHLDTDSTFDSGTFTRQLGVGALILGIEDGLNAFKQGGKGEIYIAGFRAYGKNPPPGSPFKPFEPLKFLVEVLNVSDTEPAQEQAPPPSPRN